MVSVRVICIVFYVLCDVMEALLCIGFNSIFGIVFYVSYGVEGTLFCIPVGR